MERQSVEMLVKQAREAYIRGLNVRTLAQLSLQLILVRVAIMEQLQNATSEEVKEHLRNELARLEKMEKWIALAYRALQFRGEAGRAIQMYRPRIFPEGGKVWVPY